MAIVRLIECIAYGSRYKTAFTSSRGCSAARSLAAIFAPAAVSSAAKWARSMYFCVKSISIGRRLSLNRTQCVK